MVVDGNLTERAVARAPQRQDSSRQPPLRPKTLLIFTGLAIAGIVTAILLVPIELERRELQRKRDDVLAHAFVGQSLVEAQTLLEECGYEFYDTHSRSSVLVIIGDPEPSELDWWLYAVRPPFGEWLHPGSPFVLLSADDDGIITDIR